MQVTPTQYSCGGCCFFGDEGERTMRRSDRQAHPLLLLGAVAFGLAGTTVGMLHEGYVDASSGVRSRGFPFPSLNSTPRWESPQGWGANPCGFTADVILWAIPFYWAGHAMLAFRAREAAWRERERRARKLCVTCGYDLRGQVVHRCPECGTPFKVDGDETREPADPGNPVKES